MLNIHIIRWAATRGRSACRRRARPAWASARSSTTSGPNETSGTAPPLLVLAPLPPLLMAQVLKLAAAAAVRMLVLVLVLSMAVQRVAALTRAQPPCARGCGQR